MFGHQVTREHQCNEKVHTFGMHPFFYGFTLMEMVIVIAMLPFLIFPLSTIKLYQSPIDDIIQMKRLLYQSDVSCIDDDLWMNDEWTPYECFVIPRGIQIHVEMAVIYYVQA